MDFPPIWVYDTLRNHPKMGYRTLRMRARDMGYRFTQAECRRWVFLMKSIIH